MNKVLAVIILTMVSSTAGAACTRAKLAGEYMLSGTYSLEQSGNELGLVYLTGRIILRQGGGMSWPFLHSTEGGVQRERDAGSGGWSVNQNCVGTMRLDDSEYRFTATGTAPNDILLTINITFQDSSGLGFSGQVIGRKKNL